MKYNRLAGIAKAYDESKIAARCCSNSSECPPESHCSWITTVQSLDAAEWSWWFTQSPGRHSDVLILLQKASFPQLLNGVQGPSTTLPSELQGQRHINDDLLVIGLLALDC